MCGIAGYWHPGTTLDADVLHRMAAAISHRGPDDAGTWRDDSAGIALAHRRLSILDLSPAGHQPMASATGRYVIVFNGEIYNHLELRKELQDNIWRGHSDTETFLAAFERWGVEGTLQRSVGMFAMALWDRETQTLTLTRDRLGEKPLYYGWQNGIFLFGSELKALKAHPAFTSDINREALTLFLRHSTIPSPYSIYTGIQKLPPGTYWQASLVRGHLPTGERGTLKTYWSAREAAERGQRTIFSGTDSEAIEALESVLGRSIDGQMLADVPLGAFLSGGVDSSAVVALMQARTSRPVKTFTIGFHQEGYNEAEHALAVARHRWLFRKFEHIDSGVVWGPGWTLQWSIRYFFWGLTRSRMLGLVLSAPFMFVRWFDSWIPRDFRSDGASNLFFMGKKTEDEISVNEIITFYKGAQQ